MWRNKLIWRLYLTYLLAIVIPVVAVVGYASSVFNRLYIAQITQDAKGRLALLEDTFRETLADSNNISNDNVCKTLGRRGGMRLTLILPSGRVVGETDADPHQMENHGNRPEVLDALSGRTGVSQRHSTTIDQAMLYTAAPIYRNGALAGVLRLAVPLGEIKAAERGFYLTLMIAGLFMFVVLAIIAYLASRGISKPLQQMKDGAKRFAAGDLALRLPIPRSEELGQLAQSLNAMATQLDERIRTVTRQRNELEGMLASMTEGVIAVDNDERILSMNPAAVSILGVKQSEVQGKWIHEVVRNSDLQRFLKQTSKGNGISESPIVLPQGEAEVYLQAHGTQLRDGEGRPTGALMVLTNVTQLRKLESIRKEFVANVSHELRTPLTSIKGFVETIQTGGYRLPEEVDRFLSIIATKTDRLCSIVDDILSLSSIERDGERREIAFVESAVRPVLVDSTESCQTKAGAKGINVILDCPADLSVRMNAPLLEQAVVNLVDNAIKYSDQGTTVTVSACRVRDDVRISVVDSGPGIPPEHMDRLFERFYRVDKARSRKLGGTGLGLSIVKNIVTSHGGRVAVASAVGKGSTFRIELPVAHVENGGTNPVAGPTGEH